MTLVMVPHKAERDRVHIWVAVSPGAGRPGDITLATPQGHAAVGPSASWAVVDVGGALPAEHRTTWIQTVELGGLAPGERYVVNGSVDGLAASCRPGTLPARLPRWPEAPYVIMLASCFASFQDRRGDAGRSVERLPEEFRPHLKILCGDQVYLDNPWNEILPRTRQGLARRFLDKYLATWVPAGAHDGLSRLLREGSTYFMADDHEFWNNHPNWGPLVATRGSRSRDDWEAVAGALYRSFQAMNGQDVTKTQHVAVGPLEMFLLDTQFSREAGNDQVMHPEELARLITWLGAGTAPGVVVLGAPIFTTPASWFSSRFLDRSLANYREQYGALADAILASPRSLLVLTGDVHFGRVAISKNDAASRARLVEIAASPLALVDPTVGGAFKAAPARFPDKPGRMPRSDVRTLPWNDWNDADEGLSVNHFMTLGLHGLDRGVRVRVTAWKISTAQDSELRPVAAGWQEFSLEEAI
jgi:hypothetical protein